MWLTLQPKYLASFMLDGVTKSDEIHFNTQYNHSIEMFWEWRNDVPIHHFSGMQRWNVLLFLHQPHNLPMLTHKTLLLHWVILCTHSFNEWTSNLKKNLGQMWNVKNQYYSCLPLALLIYGLVLHLKNLKLYKHFPR